MEGTENGGQAGTTLVSGEFNGYTEAHSETVGDIGKDFNRIFRLYDKSYLRTTI